MKQIFFLFLTIIRLSPLSAQSQILHDSILVEGHQRTFHFLKPAKGLSLFLPLLS